MKTPFARVRGLGTAHSGTEHFWLQRVTGIASVPLFVAFLVIIVSLAGASQASVIATLSNPFIAMIMIAALIAGLLHMQIGMRVIIEDYVHNEKLKLASVMANNFFSIAVALASIYAILKLSSGV